MKNQPKMKTHKYIYSIFRNGMKVGKTQVTVVSGSNAFNDIEAKLRQRFEIEKFNHAGKTISLINY